MNVLILANSAPGLYGFRGELLKALIEARHNVFFAVPKGDFVEEMTKMGANFVEINVARHGTNPITDLKLLAKFCSIIKNVKPDIVFTYTIKPNVYGGLACQLCGIPYVTNVTGLGTAVEKGGVLQKITLALYKIGLRKAKRVFFQNTENQKFMVERKIVSQNYSLIPGSGVNLSHFAPLPYPSENNGIHFVFISRIMREKGIDQYLNAAKYFADHPEVSQGRRIVFHICGYCEKEYKGLLEKFVAENLVVWHGVVRDVREIFKKIHCTIHPSFYPEGINNVLLESCASARPIITTDRSGCREVVDDGVNGYVVKQRDSEDLIQKIEKFLALTQEQKMQMGLAGRAKVEKEFDRKIVVNAYMKEMEALE